MNTARLRSAKTIDESVLMHSQIEAGDLISFTLASNRPDILRGMVEYKEQLGFLTVVDGVQYELKKLMNINILRFATETKYRKTWLI